jgi:DNA-binding NarL/FixJ family response regulator
MSVRGRLANMYRAIQTRDDEAGLSTPRPGNQSEAVDGAVAELAPGDLDMATGHSGRGRVMIVDDHALVREAVARALEGTEIEIVASAGSAEEAISMASPARPDLILLDIDLPAASGLDAIVELRRQAPGARIVMLTISSDDDDVSEAIRLGASGFLTKDMSSEALLRAVRDALAGNLAMPRPMAQRLIDRLGGAPAAARPKLVAEVLTGRELEILRQMSEGMTAREIAQALVLSPRTVEGHVGKILRKLGARNRVEAVQHYRRRPS